MSKLVVNLEIGEQDKTLPEAYLRVITALLREYGPGEPASAPASIPPEVRVERVEPTPEPAPETAPEAPSLEELRAALIQVGRRVDKALPRAMLAERGVQTVGDLSDAQRAELMSVCRVKLGAA